MSDPSAYCIRCGRPCGTSGVCSMCWYTTEPDPSGRTADFLITLLAILGTVLWLVAVAQLVVAL